MNSARPSMCIGISIWKTKVTGIRMDVSKMKQFKWQIILILAAIAAFFLYPYFSPVDLPENSFSTLGSDTAPAEVIQILEEGQIDLDGHTQKYQIVRVRILNGEYAGIPMEIDYGKRQIRWDDYEMSVGDQVMVSIS